MGESIAAMVVKELIEIDGEYRKEKEKLEDVEKALENEGNVHVRNELLEKRKIKTEIVKDLHDQMVNHIITKVFYFCR